MNDAFLFLLVFVPMGIVLAIGIFKEWRDDVRFRRSIDDLHERWRREDAS